MSTERLEFAEGVQALFVHGLRNAMTVQLREKLRDSGIDVGKPLLPAYTAEVFARCVALAARELRPELAQADALHWLGERSYEGWAQTMVGMAKSETLRILDPHRGLERYAQKGWPDNNYTKMEYRDLGPTCLELVLSDVNGQPALYLGRFCAGLRGMGVATPGVTMRGEGLRTVYRFTWSAAKA